VAPADPSGKVFGRDELKWIAACARERELFVLTDEIYEDFLYEGRRHVSPATQPGLADRTITISGFSKMFSITGWRIGYSACEARGARMIGYLNDLVYVCAPLQAGVAEGIRTLTPEFYERLAVEYAAKRDLLCRTLERVGLTLYVPQGAHYVLADATRLPGETSKEKAMHLLEQSRVATVSGDAFCSGSGGRNLLRFCFA